MPVIKRYANRKLYDLGERRYVTLDDIAKLIRAGEVVRVIDHQTEEDLTPLIQAQIISKEERRAKRGMPSAVLNNLIQAGSNRLQWLQDTLHLDSIDARVDAEIERRVRLLIERGELKKPAGEKLIAQLLALHDGDRRDGATEQDLDKVLSKMGIATHGDVAALERQIEALNAHVAQLSKRKTGRTAKRNSSVRNTT